MASSARALNIQTQGNPSGRTNNLKESCDEPLMKGKNPRLMAVKNRLNAINFGSPSIFTRRPISPPCTKAPMMPQ